MKKFLKFTAIAMTLLLACGCNYNDDPAKIITDAGSSQGIAETCTAYSQEVSESYPDSQTDITKTATDLTEPPVTVMPQTTVTEPTVVTAAPEPTYTTAVTTAEKTTTTTTAQQTEPIPSDRAGQILSKMSLEEKIGQVILCRYSYNAAQLQEQYRFGGFTLYANDFKNENENSIKEKIALISSKSSIPPFIAADEEGGTVVRVSRYPQFADSPLPPLSEGAKNIADFGAKMVKALKKAGVNLNLAPVADVAGPNDYIYNRTCGLSYEETGEVIAELVRVLNNNNILSCLKHFPGYGSNVDTHTGIAIDNRTVDNFEAKDFVPFKKGIDAGVPLVMVNHNIVTAYNSTVPASLAPEIHAALRGLGFKGIIVTDDLGMGAITTYTNDPYADAFLAGNDLLCTSDGPACYNSVYNAVKNGKISESRINESVYRILSVKLRYGILS